MSGIPINEVKVGDTSVYVRREDLYVDQLPEGIDLRGVEFDISQIGVDPPPTGKARGILSYLAIKHPQDAISYYCNKLDPRTITTCKILAYYARLLGKKVTFVCDVQAGNDFSRPNNRGLLDYLQRLDCDINESDRRFGDDFFYEHNFYRWSADKIPEEISYMCARGVFIEPNSKSALTAIVVSVSDGSTIAGIIDGLMHYHINDIIVIGIVTDHGQYWTKNSRRIICSLVPSYFATPWCARHLKLFRYEQLIPIKQVAKECPFPSDPKSSLRAWSMLACSASYPLVSYDLISPRTLFWNTSA